MLTDQPGIDAIFCEAIEIASPTERDAYLQQACGCDPERRRQVDRLLRAHFGAGSFLAECSRAFAATMPQQTSVTAAPGMVIGPYKLLQQIGEGGMGVVYMAEQTEPVERRVAVKIIKPGMDSREVIARFESERQALAMMDHPNIAKVLDAGTTGGGVRRQESGVRGRESDSSLTPDSCFLAPDAGRPYFVMELVKGLPITRYCDEHRLSLRERLELFVPVLHAVQHAHQKGIIHRDLKPSNVLVAEYDNHAVPKIIDFGVAKATGGKLTERTMFTQYGQLVGTLEYMSPEQAKFNQLDVDTRSDIYSLGVLLYELLTGTTPFAHERLRTAAFDELLRILREEDPPRPSTRLIELGSGRHTPCAVFPDGTRSAPTTSLASIAANRHIEPARLSRLMRGELDWIVMKALDKDRARRYETANGFAADVLHYLADEPVTACPPSAAYRFRKFAWRNRAALLATAAVATTLIMGTVASALLASRAIEAEGLAKTRLAAETAALNAAKNARAASNAAKNEAVSMRDRAVADMYRALLGETRALREARPANWRATALDNLRQLAVLDTPSRDPVELRSEAVACLGELDAREIDRFEGHSHLVYGLDFSPDGKTLASAGYDGKVCLWNRGQRRPVLQLTDVAASNLGLWGSGAPLPIARFRPDGGCLAYTTWSRQVAFLSLNEADASPPAIASPSQPRDITFDRQAKRMAVSWGDGRVGVYDAHTGALKRMIDARTPEIGFYMRVALSPSGDLLATRGPGETIQLFRLDSDANPVVLGPHRGLIRGLVFSSDGRLLASASEDRTAKVWSVSNGKEVLTLQGHASKVISIAFSPDDELIATGSDDGTVRLWEAQTGHTLIVLASKPQRNPGAFGGIQAVAFSQDGNRIAAASQAVVVYEILPRHMRRLPGHGFFTPAVAFHPTQPIMATSSRSPDVTFWDLETGRELHRRSGLPGVAGSLAFSPDGSLLAAAPWARVPTFLLSDDVSLLETSTGQVRRTLSGPSSAIAFDSSGRWLAAGDRHGQLWLWSVAIDRLPQHWPVAQGSITDVQFIRDGSQLVVGDVGGTVLVWDLARGRQVDHTTLPGGLLRFVVDPRERLLAAANFMGEVRILSLADLQVRCTLERFFDPTVVALAFRNDGQSLAVGGTDRRLTIWDTRTCEISFSTPPLNAPILDLAFQPDGSRLAVATGDELIPIWDFAALHADLERLGLLDGMPSVAGSSADGSQLDTASTVRRIGRIGVDGIISMEWAAWCLEHVLETKPDQPSACLELAWIRVMGPKALRDPDAALPLARRAVELAPNNPDCLNTLGGVLYRLGRWDEAVETLHAAARANPEGASGYDLFFLAMSHQRLGEAEQAREQFDRATRWWAGADVDSKQADELTTIQAEAELVLQDRNDPPATADDQRAAGRVYAGMRLWTLAARHFARAADLTPDDPQPWEERGRAHAHLGQWRDAERCFAKAVELNSDDIGSWYRHAIAHAGAGDLDAYKRVCADMVDRFRGTQDPGVASRVLYACVPVQGAGADGEELVRLANIAVPWFRGNVRVLGAALYRAGRYDASLERFAELDTVGTPKAWDWLFQAMACARLNRRDAALQYLARATAWIEQADLLDTGNSMDRWVDWFEPVEVRLLLREAEGLLAGAEEKNASVPMVPALENGTPREE